MHFWIREHGLEAFLAIVLAAVMVSDTVGGFLWRASMMAPLVWLGMMDDQAAVTFAQWSLF